MIEKRGAVVLCGGKSSRMGLSKAMLPFGDEVMLTRVLRLLSDVVSVRVVVAAQDQELPVLADDIIVVRDNRPGRGPLEGLLAGLQVMHERVEAVYATSCDVPLLVPGFVQQMFQLLGDHSITVARDDRFFHPLAAVYRTSVLESIEELLSKDELRPRRLFSLVDTHEVPVADLRSVDPELVTLENLNQPNDYVAALEKAGLTADPATLAALGLA